MRPRVSVLAAAFNHEPYVAQSIESVLAQTEKSWELIIVDDASSDSTVAVIEQFKDARIQLHRNSRNRGIIPTSRKAWELAQAPYIYWLDTDDILEPQALELLADQLDDNQSWLGIFGLPKIIDEHGAFSGEGWTKEGVTMPRESKLRTLFTGLNLYCATAGLVRNEALSNCGYFPENLFQLHDLAQWMKMLSCGELKIIDEYVVRYRRRAGFANASAPTAAVRARTAVEQYVICKSFILENCSHEKLEELFPEAAQLPGYGREIPAEFFWAQICLELPLVAHRLIALELLHRLMSSLPLQRLIEQRCGFDLKTLFDLSGQPLFAFEEDRAKALSKELLDLKQSNKDLQAEHLSLQKNWSNITKSQWWKIISFVSTIKNREWRF